MGSGRREPSVMTICFPLFVEFWKHYVLSGETQCRKLTRYQNEEMKTVNISFQWESNPQPHDWRWNFVIDIICVLHNRLCRTDVLALKPSWHRGTKCASVSDQVNATRNVGSTSTRFLRSGVEAKRGVEFFT